MSQNKIVEARLEIIERRMEAWRCLMQIASGTCLLITCIAFPVLLLVRFTWILVALPLLLFAVVWGVSRLWSPMVILGPIGIVIGTIWTLRENQMGLYQRDWATPSVLEWVLFLSGAALLCVPVLVFAFRALTIAHEERSVVALPKGRTFGLVPALLAVLGVHPICQWLPWQRRIMAATFFALCQTFIGLSMIVALFFMTVYLVNTSRKIECLYEGFSTWAGCVGTVIGTLVAPAVWLSVFVGLAGGLRYLARRSSWRSMESVRHQDPRRPALFLRSFSDDQVRLSRPKRNLFGRLILLGEPRPLLDHILLEQGTSAGPVVAIGAPRSRPPFGAARAYVTDDEWQKVVAELAATARVVVIAVDQTAGVMWELNHLYTCKYTSKVLHLLPPSLAQPEKARQVVAAARNGSSEISAYLEPLSLFLRVNERPCIGWYFQNDAKLTILTTMRPNEVSYLIAVRKFLRSLAAQG
jgi:hypothetical protein